MRGGGRGGGGEGEAHGRLPAAKQNAALAPSKRRKIVLSTNLAETSVTLQGARVVVDAGLAREPRFDARTGMSRLATVATSRASAEQRSGRAGRTAPGHAYRLWSQIEHGSRPRHRTPEILQADLAGFALELAAWGVRGERDNPLGDLVFIDPPPAPALRQARDLLTALRAIDGDDRADDRDLVDHLGRVRQQLTDVGPRHRRGDRAKRPSRVGVGLGVPCFQLTDSTMQENIQHLPTVSVDLIRDGRASHQNSAQAGRS